MSPENTGTGPGQNPAESSTSSSGASNSVTGTGDTSNSGSTTGVAGAAAGAAATGSGSGSTPNDSQGEKKFSQEDLNRLAGNLRAEFTAKLTEASNKAETDKKAAEAKAAEEEAAKQGKFQELYLKAKEELTTTSASFTSVKEANTKLAAIVTENINEQIKGWPDSLKKLDPGTANPENIMARLEWVNNSRELAEQFTQMIGKHPNTEHGRGNSNVVSGGTSNVGDSNALTKSYLGRYKVPGAK